MLLSKSKYSVLVFIVTVLSVVLYGCSSSSSITENTTSKVEDTTVAETSTANEYETFLEDGSKYNIDLTAKYNEEENTVDTILTNNTGDLYVFPGDEHYFYKQDGDNWENVTFSYGYIFNQDSISPKKGENTYNRSFCAYPSSNDNGNDINEARKTKYFTPGKYKIAVKLSICDPLEYTEIDNDGKTETFPRYDKNRFSFMKEAYFIVE
ncbi:hypothetical protein [Ruminococcus sp.]|jgi:signal peptidase I|uniref:hypothetical protein n=1 Tax=Ruminococcus sp. TaxID=41978 RepID=UPI00261775CC|nr:hypothetical protein [Ruminococcus sp.]MCI2112533.1 hypothetical protein [Ruminococcus sp.]MDD6988469.1 hypothetical protein [Ruminococcus sp.]MDY6200782.1 hypothetical protein [Ruminococcus sp.]